MLFLVPLDVLHEDTFLSCLHYLAGWGWRQGGSFRLQPNLFQSHTESLRWVCRSGARTFSRYPFEAERGHTSSLFHLWESLSEGWVQFFIPSSSYCILCPFFPAHIFSRHTSHFLSPPLPTVLNYMLPFSLACFVDGENVGMENVSFVTPSPTYHAKQSIT